MWKVRDLFLNKAGQDGARFQIVGENSYWTMYFKEPEMEKRYQAELQESDLKSGLRMLMFINGLYFSAYTVDNKFFTWGTLTSVAMMAACKVVMKFPRWRFYHTKLAIFYGTALLFRLPSMVRAGFCPAVDPCQEPPFREDGSADSVKLSEVVAFFDGHYVKDCSIWGSTSILTWLFMIGVSPYLFPRLKTIHWMWCWIAVVCFTCYYLNGGLLPWPEALLRMLLLVLTTCMAVVKKNYMSKSRRKKYVDDVRQREASQKAFHILEYMLPVHVIVPMIQNPGGVIAEHHARSSILFIVIEDFDQYAHKLPPKELLQFLNDYFGCMDSICQANKVTKIETVSEEYVAAVGVVPEDAQIDREQGHSEILGRLTTAAITIFQLQSGGLQFKMGMHTGPVVAGVIGLKLPRFRLFGDTINTAARMMQKGFPGKLQLGEETKNHLPPGVAVSFRGEVEMKGKGMVKTYLLDAPKHLTVDQCHFRTHRNQSIFGSKTSYCAGGANPGPKAPLLTPQEAEEKLRFPRCSRDEASTRHRSRLTGEVEMSLVESKVASCPSAVRERSEEQPRATSVVNLDLRERLSDDVLERFEKALQEVPQTDKNQDSNSWSYRSMKRALFKTMMMDLERFTPEVEQEWLEWFHSTRIVHKFPQRVERQMVTFSVYAAITTALMLFHRDLRAPADEEHPVWGASSLGAFLLAHLVALVLCIAWRAVAGSEWFLNEPRLVQRNLLITMCIWAVCMFCVHDALLLKVDVLEDVNGTSWMEACGRFENDSYFMELPERCRKHFVNAIEAQQWIVMSNEGFLGLLFSCWMTLITTTHELTSARTSVFIGLAIVFLVTVRGNESFSMLPEYTGIHFSRVGGIFFVCNSIVVTLMAHTFERSSRLRFKAKWSIANLSKSIEGILDTLMPPHIIEQIRDLPLNADPPSHSYRQATIAQSDLCGFTKLASTRSPFEVVKFISEIFGLFDDLCDKHEVYKVETVGDAYIAGQAGWPLTQRNSPASVLHFGLDMIRQVHIWARDCDEEVSCRVGVHHGSCIGGIVGTEMQRYHLFGGLMAVLELLESTSAEGRVQVSTACSEAVLRQMRQENIDPEALVFEPRREPHLSTSKNDIVPYRDVGGPTFLVRRCSPKGRLPAPPDRSR